MKRILVFLTIIFVSVFDLYGGNGSLLVLKNTYFYSNSKKEGKRILTRKRVAYDVLDTEVVQGSQMYEVLVFDRKNIVNESGFVVETDPELRALGPKKVKVFTKIPTKKSDLTLHKLVPSNQLSFTGRRETTNDFPFLTWREVNFKTNLPHKYWIAAWSGVYRPDKNADWLNRIYRKVRLKKYNADIELGILMGLVETGFTKEQVRLAIGDPEKEQFAQGSDQLEWIYPDRKVIFKNNRVLQVL